MASPENLKEFLQMYPWLPSENLGKSTVDTFWKFTLKGTAEDYWPFMTDTSYFNKILGLPEMQYREENGVLHGTSVNAGFTLEWREVPWEWEYLKGLNNARVYSKGFAHYVRVRYIIDSAGSDSIVFKVYFGWVPTNLGTFLLLKTGMRNLRKDYEKALAKIEQIIQTRRQISEREKEMQLLTRHDNLTEPALKLLAEQKAAALKSGANAECLEKLSDIIVNGSNEEVIKLKVRALAKAWKTNETETLKTFLHAAHAGMLYLSWDVTCPHCRGVRESLNTLGDIRETSKCDACEIEFSTQDKEIIEVLFHINPAIRKAEKKFYCAAEPATKRHILIQKKVPALADIVLKTELASGKYRLRFKGNQQPALLQISDEGNATVLYKGDSETLVAGMHPVIKAENYENHDTTLVVERDEFDDTALRPADLFSFQYFRDLFVTEGLASGLKLEAGVQNILFTDVVASTSMYRKIGDAAAFAAVRDHFVRIFDIVRKHNGAVVKTIGDATMVAFVNTANALQAAIEMQKQFDGSPKAGPLKLRISIHKGNCLAVNLNSSIDYFGNTVNHAAKIQQAAGARQIVFTPEVSDDPMAHSVLNEAGLTRETLQIKQAWSETTLPIYRVTVA